MSEGLDITKLSGKLEDVEIIDSSVSEKDNNKICVLKCTYKEQPRDVGLFGEDVITTVLEKHGRQEGDKNILQIPAKKLVGEGVVWINTNY